MADRPVIVAPAMIRPLVEPLLPHSVEMRWFASTPEAVDMAPDADIGWFDAFTPETRAQASLRAEKARWVNTIRAGLDDVPIDLLASRGTIVTNGTGLHAQAVADYALLGVLTLAKRLDEIVRAHDRGEWLSGPPGMAELEGSQALIIGYGVIGAAIGTRLAACGAQIVPVRRTADPANGILGAGDWREHLGEMDWVILAAPATDDTRAMIGEPELAAMKPTAGLVNIARGDLIDQAALIAALDSRSIGGAFLDVTSPEPLPPEDPLWKAPRSLVTMHMSGRSQTSLFRKGAERFARNLRAWLAGEPLEAVVDPARGY